jgi:hypothetical protein
MRNSTYLWGAALTALALLMTGCAVPDVQPFADATVDLAGAVRQVGQEVTATMRQASETPAERDTELAAEADRLEGLWSDRNRAMDMLIAYADALANIAQSGQSARQQAEALTASISSLASYLPGPGALSNEAATIMNLVFQTAEEVRRAHDLAGAIDRAHPLVEGITGILRDDLAGMRSLYRINAAELFVPLDDAYLGHRAYREALLLQRALLRAEYIRLRAAAEDAQQPDSEREAAAARADLLLVDIQQCEEHAQLTDEPEQAYQAARVALARRRDTVLGMIDAAIAGITALEQSHRDLRDAVRHNRRPNVRLIVLRAMEIRQAVQMLRDR